MHSQLRGRVFDGRQVFLSLNETGPNPENVFSAECVHLIWHWETQRMRSEVLSPEHIFSLLSNDLLIRSSRSFIHISRHETTRLHFLNFEHVST